MYAQGELLIYGQTGVCRVEGFTRRKVRSATGSLKEVDYYVLDPLYQDGTIYIPVETKVFMRPVISRQEAEALIDQIPMMRAEAYHSRSVQMLAAHYEEALQSHNCRDLVELVMSIYAKKQYVESQKRQFGQVDARFMKRAEDLLYGELSVALGLAKDAVQGYIEQRVGAMEQKKEA